MIYIRQYFKVLLRFFQFILNLKPDMSVKKIFINVRNVKIALTRKNVSKGTTVKYQSKNETKSSQNQQKHPGRGSFW